MEEAHGVAVMDLVTRSDSTRVELIVSTSVIDDTKEATDLGVGWPMTETLIKTANDTTRKDEPFESGRY